MLKINSQVLNDKLQISLDGKLDSSNAAEAETQIEAAIGDRYCVPRDRYCVPGDRYEAAGTRSEVTAMELDFQKLTFISSAGLRILLRLNQRFKNFSIRNVNRDVYEILQMTGFTDIMDVKKAMREVSYEGAELIAAGANSRVYRLNADTILKVFKEKNTLEDIERENFLAKQAFVFGIPTAISYDIVKVDGHYGTMYEMLEATTMTELMEAAGDRYEAAGTRSGATGTYPRDEFGKLCERYVGLLKEVHKIEDSTDRLPDMKDVYRGYVRFVKEYVPADVAARIAAVVEAVPDSVHLVHGDFQTNNVMQVGDELFLIDMDTLSVGDPVWDLVGIYCTTIAFPETYRHDDIPVLSGDKPRRLFEETFMRYYGQPGPCTGQPEPIPGQPEPIPGQPEPIPGIRAVIQVLGFTRMLRRTIKHHDAPECYERAYRMLMDGLEKLEK